MNNIKKFASRYNKFAVFIGSTILVSIFLVSISMFVYYQSDAYRLDLSRPEYTSRRSEISKNLEDKSKDFDAQGSVNEQTIKEFLKLYDDEAKGIAKTKAFSNDVLSDKELLGINNNENSSATAGD